MPTQTKSSATKKSTINKKPIFISVGIIVLLVLGIGGYALWQNMGAHAAGGWTNVGVSTITTSSNKKFKITATSYACKIAVPRLGYRIKSYTVITSSTNTSFKIRVGGNVGGAPYAYGNIVLAKVGQKSSAAVSGVGPSTEKAHVGIVWGDPKQVNSTYLGTSASKLVTSIVNC